MTREHRPPWQLYKEEMDSLCLQSEALWEPASADYTRIRIGDVGFIRCGQFHLLFHAGSPLEEVHLGDDVPSTFRPLTIGNTTFRDPRPPNCLHTGAVEEYAAGLGATVPTPLPLEPGAHLSFKLTGNHGAALRTTYPTYMEDARFKSTFESYVKRHYESWVTFARDKEYGDDVQPVLVSGFDMTRDYAMLAYSNRGLSLEAGAEINALMFASASASVTVTRHTECSPHFKCGPEPWGLLPDRQAIDFPQGPRSADPRATPNVFNQCVFIRYYTARLRTWLPPKVFRAGAGPHDLGSRDDIGETFPELTAQSNAEPATGGDDDPIGRSDLLMDDTDSEPIIVVRNAPYDGEYTNWDAVADYIFQDPKVVFALMHHRDLAGIRMPGEMDDISTLLTKRRPHVVVDTDGVGRIPHQGIRQPGVPVLPPPTTTGSEPQTSCDTTTNLESHPAVAAELNPSVEVEVGIEDRVREARVKKRGPRGTIRLEGACTSCRRRKKKCDGRRPCTTCLGAGRDSECYYDVMRAPHHVISPLPSTTHSPPFLDGPEPGPANAGSFSQLSFGEDMVDVQSPDDTEPSVSNPVATSLRESEAQVFIDVIDGALDGLEPTSPVLAPPTPLFARPPCRHGPTRRPAVEKKALLIGISYDHNKVGGEWGTIPTSIPDVRRMAAFLRGHCGYTNIVIMTDEDGVEERYRPTKHNLEREIAALCRGAVPGDHRFFYYAGHSGQLPCPTGSEEDENDETIVTVDGNEIRDNMLHEWLVKPLPKGSKLTAIFDSCDSGTLFDLGHYRCNNVYQPWVNRGRRRSRTLQNRAVRKNGRDTCSTPPSRPRSVFREGSGEADTDFRSLIQALESMYQTTTSEPAQVAEEFDKHYGERYASPEHDEHERERCAPPERTEHDGEMRVPPERDDSENDGERCAPRERTKHGGERCASPEPQFQCDGWCRKKMSRMTTLDHPDVISISSSNDGQTSWDASTRNGGSISMTTFLVDILEQKPQVTYSDLMTLLNHKVYSFTRDMHRRVKERRARRIADGEKAGREDAEPEEGSEGEMDNFQDLQLGSLSPIDMDRVFVL